MARRCTRSFLRKLRTYCYLTSGIIVLGLLLSASAILAIIAARCPQRKAYRLQLLTCQLFQNQGFNSQMACLETWCANEANWPLPRCQSTDGLNSVAYDPVYNSRHLSSSFPLDRDSAAKGWTAFSMIFIAAILQALSHIANCLHFRPVAPQRFSLTYKCIMFASSVFAWLLVIASAVLAIIGSAKVAGNWGLYNAPVGLWASGSILSVITGSLFLFYDILLMSRSNFLSGEQTGSVLPETDVKKISAFESVASPLALTPHETVLKKVIVAHHESYCLPELQPPTSSSQSTLSPGSSNSGTSSDQSSSPSNAYFRKGILPFSSDGHHPHPCTRKETQSFPLNGGQFQASNAKHLPNCGPPWTDPLDHHVQRNSGEFLHVADQGAENMTFPSSCPRSKSLGDFLPHRPRPTSDVNRLPHSKSMCNGGTDKPPRIGMRIPELSAEELADATEEFAARNKLGEGGFGCVFKGMLPDGSIVAVKRLHTGLGPAKSAEGMQELKSEVDIISRVHHRNLLKLVGFSIDEQDKLMLAYEFMPNGSLHDQLHCTESNNLSWQLRIKIATGAARGLAYLHGDCYPKIVHRDIKAMNILLDSDFDAKVADFGLARLVGDEGDHVSTRVMGTFGYLAPDYAFSGRLTEKSDVYSFGVVLLELLTGRKPIEHSYDGGQLLVNLAEWAWRRQAEKVDPIQLVDSRLEGCFPTREARCLWDAALHCIQRNARNRPSMEQVLRMILEGQDPLPSNGAPLNDIAVLSSLDDVNHQTIVSPLGQHSNLSVSIDKRRSNSNGSTQGRSFPGSDTEADEEACPIHQTCATLAIQTVVSAGGEEQTLVNNDVAGSWQHIIVAGTAETQEGSWGRKQGIMATIDPPFPAEAERNSLYQLQRSMGSYVEDVQTSQTGSQGPQSETAQVHSVADFQGSLSKKKRSTDEQHEKRKLMYSFNQRYYVDSFEEHTDHSGNSFVTVKSNDSYYSAISGQQGVRIPRYGTRVDSGDPNNGSFGSSARLEDRRGFQEDSDGFLLDRQEWQLGREDPREEGAEEETEEVFGKESAQRLGVSPLRSTMSSPESVGAIFRGLLQTAEIERLERGGWEDDFVEMPEGINLDFDSPRGSLSQVRTLNDGGWGSGRLLLDPERKRSLTKLIQEERYEEALSQLSSSGEWNPEDSDLEVSSPTAKDSDGQVAVLPGVRRKRRPGDAKAGTQPSRLRVSQQNDREWAETTEQELFD